MVDEGVVDPLANEVVDGEGDDETEQGEFSFLVFHFNNLRRIGDAHHVAVEPDQGIGGSHSRTRVTGAFDVAAVDSVVTPSVDQGDDVRLVLGLRRVLVSKQVLA